MLVISLKVGETIQIGDAKVTFKRKSSTRQIKVLIDAPKSTIITRLGNLELESSEADPEYEYPQQRDL